MGHCSFLEVRYRGRLVNARFEHCRFNKAIILKGKPLDFTPKDIRKIIRLAKKVFDSSQCFICPG